MDKLFNEYLSSTLVGNELWRILGLFSSILIALIIGRIGRHFLSKTTDHLNPHKEVVHAALHAISRSILFVSFTIGVKIGLCFLVYPETAASLVNAISGVLISLAVGFLSYCLVSVIDVWLTGFASRTEGKLDDMLVPMVRKSLRSTITILVVLQIATILSDKPLTSIIAGLGVGGLALALAAQDTIKNFFGSLVIFTDKPFELGDRIKIDGHDGPVEEVGIRSTRIRTLEGHLVTVPNGELANKTIQNIGQRPHIRRVANITITYDTPPEKVRRAISIIKELLDKHEGMHPDFPPRVFFNEFNDVSLNILVLYWYHPPNYWDYCKFNEQLNLAILERFNNEGIEFAFPTQTLFVAGDQKRPLDIQVHQQHKV